MSERNYLQNGICYKDLATAQNDFLSRIEDPYSRQSWADRFSYMQPSEIERLFPPCQRFGDYYLEFFVALISVVVLLLCFRYIKRASEL